MATTRAEPTPNPNSLKFTTDEGLFLESGMVACSSQEDAEDHPLAHRLFSIPVVEDVFITPDFVTVSKQEGTDWAAAKPEIESILSEHLDAE